MFVTKPAYETKDLAFLMEAETRCWQLMLISTNAPWYLLTFKVGEGPEEVLQSAVVAWETYLIGLVEQVGPSRVVSLRLIAPEYLRPGDWAMSSVAEAWLPSDDELDDAAPLLFRFFERPGIHDSYRNLVAESDHRRQLLKLQL